MIEIEKKYRITSEQRLFVLRALGEIGAEHTGDDLEENIIFSNDELAAKNAMLRVRKTQSRTTLTYKQGIAQASDAKHQTEFETEVANPENVIEIVQNLGFFRRVVYEKRRETWKFRNVEIVLDELPFGFFMEIEGPITGIKEAEILLDAENFEAVESTYPRLTTVFGTRNGDVIESRFPREPPDTNER